MIIYALHKTNGYLYKYDTSNENDIGMWFEGRSCDDIVKAFNMDARDVGGDYENDSVGMEVKLEYVDGVMDGSKRDGKPKFKYRDIIRGGKSANGFIWYVMGFHNETYYVETLDGDECDMSKDEIELNYEKIGEVTQDVLKKFF